MALIRKNIWLLFQSIFFLATIFLFIISYSEYKEIYNDFIIQNEHNSKLIAKSTENYFEQLDIAITLLGDQFLEK